MISGDPINDALQEALRGSGRSYIFAIHGRSPYSPPVREIESECRVRSKRATEPYRCRTPDNFDIRKFSQHERLMGVFRILEQEGGHGAGPDGLTYYNFSSGEIYAALRTVSQAIRDQNYRPYATREVRLEKPNGGERVLALQNISDRIVSKALQLSLEDFWRPRLPRRGVNVWETYKQIQDAVRREKKYVLAVDDVKNCFPSAPLDQVIECHRQHITQPDLLWLIETVIRGNNPERMIGLEQGSPYSPVAMELLLHTRLDLPFRREDRGFPLFRYVDNLIVLCDSEWKGREALQAIENILQPLGMQLKGEDGSPHDLREQYDRTILGLIPGWKDGRMTFRIHPPAFEKLQQGLVGCHCTRHPSDFASRVINGWLEAVGPTLTNKARMQILEKVIETARECGFTEFSQEDFTKVTQSARRRWVSMCNGG